MEQIQEPIKLVTIFQDQHVRPYMFAWNGRTYKIEQLHGYHATKEGSTTTYHWSVSANSNIYQLAWNNETLEAQLESTDAVAS